MRNEIISLINTSYYENYAVTLTKEVIKLNGGVAALYSLATDNSLNLPKPQKEKAMFRSAYTLEYIYFHHHSLFKPFELQFFEDFPKTINPSVRRLFAKMMVSHLSKLKNCATPEQLEAIAQSAAEWVADSKTRVAVKVWAMEILKILRDEILWINEIWTDLVEILKSNATPAIECRMRRNFY